MSLRPINVLSFRFLTKTDPSGSNRIKAKLDPEFPGNRWLLALNRRDVMGKLRRTYGANEQITFPNPMILETGDTPETVAAAIHTQLTNYPHPLLADVINTMPELAGITTCNPIAQQRGNLSHNELVAYVRNTGDNNRGQFCGAALGLLDTGGFIVRVFGLPKMTTNLQLHYGHLAAGPDRAGRIAQSLLYKGVLKWETSSFFNDSYLVFENRDTHPIHYSSLRADSAAQLLASLHELLQRGRTLFLLGMLTLPELLQIQAAIQSDPPPEQAENHRLQPSHHWVVNITHALVNAAQQLITNGLPCGLNATDATTTALLRLQTKLGETEPRIHWIQQSIVALCQQICDQDRQITPKQYHAAIPTQYSPAFLTTML